MEHIIPYFTEGPSSHFSKPSVEMGVNTTKALSDLDAEPGLGWDCYPGVSKQDVQPMHTALACTLAKATYQQKNFSERGFPSLHTTRQ